MEEKKGSWTFQVPTKHIHNREDISIFKVSRAHAEIAGFIRALNDSVLKTPTTHECFISPAVKSVLSALDILSSDADAIEPLLQENNRFGNKSFRTWHSKLVERSQDLHLDIFSRSTSSTTTTTKEETHEFPLAKEDPIGAAAEIGPYLQDSFGNPVRIDYGTGHELHFICWLFCLRAIRIFHDEDKEALVTRVFVKYLELCRKLQIRYKQEPAGSHGVWGLDDHQFIPFIWGSAQLIDHPTIVPGSVLDQGLVTRHEQDSLYLSCISHIYKVKKGPFFEHSPDLYNISAAASWKKINGGMFKKFEDDVLAKWPVVQHLLFGSIIPWEEPQTPQQSHSNTPISPPSKSPSPPELPPQMLH